MNNKLLNNIKKGLFHQIDTKQTKQIINKTQIGRVVLYHSVIKIRKRNKTQIKENSQLSTDISSPTTFYNHIMYSILRYQPVHIQH